MTTTTGNAARVLDWLEEWLQTEWPDLRVYCTIVTEQWATVGVAGRRARRARRVRRPRRRAPLFPHMPCARHDRRRAARIVRVSFTGELSYEITCRPAWLAPVEARDGAARRTGITPYGTEAMHVLRAEKGYIIVGQETDGTVTPLDLGMGWIVSKAKRDFIGKRSFARADTTRDDRKQLVGLLPEDPALRLARRHPAGRPGAFGGDRGAALPGADDRARDLELSQRRARPLVRAGIGQARPRAHRRILAGAAAVRRGGPGHDREAGVLRPRGCPP
jgi:glycine cleavage system aminomethyltransferase T